MARRSQCSSQGDNPLDPHDLPPHYREEYRLAVDALVEEDLQGYYEFLQSADVVDFLCPPEVDHIRRSVQFPSQNIQPVLPYPEAGDDASSGTYWPLHSDVEAPSLDLGWPDPHSFLGPTEVTMLVNPSAADVPSIKDQARRLISSAQQVIGVVMDMFTDVDIFADLLDASMRNVAVYILLDELNAHYFTAMVSSCKVNLEKIPLMCIRTVSGTSYFCRTGKSFKGQMMDRFLLVDCTSVLSGNYSFMWSFEKIHRCIAQLFHGELVTTYDEEFRILYAQSQALVTESALVPLPGESGYSSHMTQSFRDNLPTQSSRYAPNLRLPFGDKMDVDYNMLPFRRSEPFCSPLGASQMQMYSNVHPSKHLKMEQTFMEQGRSMMALKRHSYAEGSHASSGSSQQLTRHRVMNNPEESAHLSKEQRYHEVGSGSWYGINYNIKSQGYNQTDQYFDSGYPLEMTPPGTYGLRADYLCSSLSKDIIHDSENHDNNPQRLSMSQPYTCQPSLTQLDPFDLSPVMTSHNRQPQDPGTKQGLRKWRINSFLSAMEDEEALTVPLGPDAFDELPRFSEAKLCTPEPSVVKFNTEEFPRISTSKQELIQQYSWSNQPEEQNHPSGKHAAMATNSKVMPEASESFTATQDDKAGEMEVREPREISITKQESFRSRFNPLLQRSSRLRSSLIFGPCNLEQNSSMLITENKYQKLKEELPQAEKPVITAPTEPLPIIPSFINMHDPETRFLYFKRLAAERKAAKRSEESAVAGPDPPENVTDTSLKTSDISPSLASTNMKMKDSSGIGEVPAAQETKHNPTETHTEKHEIEKISSHSATNMPLTDPVKSLQSKTFNWSGRNRTEVHEATNQKSEESTEESSEQSPKDHLPKDPLPKDPLPKDPLPKEKSNLAELAQLKLPPKGKPIITAPTEPLLVTPSFINMDDPEMRFLYFKLIAAERKAAKLFKESTIGGPDLSENGTGTTLKMPSISENLADTNMTDISAMGKEPAVQEAAHNPTKALINEPSISTTLAEPISKKAEISVASKLENQTSAVIHPARPDLKYNNSQPSAYVSAASKGSPNSFKKNILKPPEDLQSLKISCDKNIYRDVTDTEKNEIKKGSQPGATSMEQTDPKKAGQDKPFNLSGANRTVVPETTDQKSKELTEETSVTSLTTAGISLNLTDTNKNMADISIMGEELVIQEATQSPKETLINKPSISSLSAEPISKKPDVSIAQELENQIPAVAKQTVGPNLQYTNSQPSADVPVATKGSSNSFTRDILKPPEDLQSLKIYCDKKIYRDVTDTEKNEIKKGSQPGATSRDQTDPEKVGEDRPFNLSCANRTVVPEATDQKSKELTEETSLTSLTTAGISLNLTDTNKNMADISIMGEELVIQEATQSPKETLIDKPSISSSSAEPISKKPDVSIVQELENQIPAVVKQTAGPEIQYYNSQPSADVPVATKGSPNSFTRDILKPPEDLQSLKIACDKNIYRDVTDTEKNEIKKGSQPDATSRGQTDPEKAGQDKPFNLSCANRTVVPEATDQKSKELTEETSVTSLTTAGISLNLTDTNKNMADISIMREELVIQEATLSPKETLIDKPSISSSSAEPISKKPDVSIVQELENHIPAVVKQTAGPDLQYNSSQPSADVPVATKGSPNSFTRDILKPPEDLQSLKIACDKNIYRDVTDTEKNEIKKGSQPGATSRGQTDPEKVGEDRPFNLSRANRTVVPEATDQKSKELTEETSLTSLTTAGISLNLTDTNKNMAGISIMGEELVIQEATLSPKETLIDKPSISSSSAEPISKTPDVSIAQELENQIPAVVKQTAGPEIQYYNSQPSADVPVATKGSPNSFTRDILKPPEDLQSLKIYCDKNIYRDVTDTEKNEIKKGSQPDANSMGQTDPEKAGQDKPCNLSCANRTVVPEGTDQKSKELTEETRVTSLTTAGISLNLTDTNKNMGGISIMGEELVIQEATLSPKVTLIDKPSISSSSAEPISKKPDVSIVQELENQIPAVVKQTAGPDLQYNSYQLSADVPVATKPNSFTRDILKPPEDLQNLKISCDMKIHQNASDTEKHEIKNSSGHSATSKTLIDPGKSLKNKPFNLSSDNDTVANEAPDQKSKESASEKSSKDYLPKEETKLPERASESSKVSVARALDLSANITDSSLKTADISLNLTDTNVKMTDVSVIEKEPAPQEAIQSQIETLIDKPLTDATDTQKHAIKIASGHSTSSMAPTDPGKSLKNKSDSNSNLSLTDGSSEVKQDGKAMESMETHTQNPRGVIGTLGNEKLTEMVASDKTFSETVRPLPEVCNKAPCLESQSPIEAKQAIEWAVTKSKEEKATSKASQSLHQTSTNSVIHTCNLRDDTKVILEQISANNQNRVDLAMKAEGSTDDAKMGKDEGSTDLEGRPSKPQQSRTKLFYNPVNPQERENLLKKIEKMRKEKKIYSRFELGS